MLLLRTSYSYGVFLEKYFNFKLVRLGVYIVKLCHEKMLILRCILPPPPPQKKIEPPIEKKNFPPLENLEHPDRKLNSVGIILTP